jgi:predicted XRE-type DNA-binding protein
MKKNITITHGSGNVFADVGLENADQLLIKAKVASYIGALIHKNNLTQNAAALKINAEQPDVSKLLRGKLEGFSLERLLEYAKLLGSDIEIRAKTTRGLKKGQFKFISDAAA